MRTRRREVARLLAFATGVIIAVAGKAVERK
jgi:hypothetical protein